MSTELEASRLLAHSQSQTERSHTCGSSRFLIPENLTPGVADNEGRCLSYLERDDGERGEDDGDNPEADGDLGFVEQSFGPRHLDGAAGVHLLHLGYRGAEVVVDGGALEEALLHALLLAPLVVEALDDDREALDEEHAAEDGDEQLLADDDGADGDDAADGEAAGVAHEHLRGEGIVPQEADEGTHEGTEVDHQLFGAGDVHDVEVAGHGDVTGHIGQDAEHDADDGGVTGGHAVHAVVQVSAIGHGGNHEDSHEDEQYPATQLLVLTHPVKGVGIVKVVVLDEGDGGLGRLLRLALVHDYSALPCAALHLDVLADDGLVAQVEREAHDDAKTHLTDDLELAMQTLLVALEHLDVVVGKAEAAQPHGGDEHKDHVDVVELAQQETGDEDGRQDDDTAHGGDAYLLHAEGVDAGVALRLGDLLALEQVDEVLTEHGGHQQGDEGSQE